MMGYGGYGMGPGMMGYGPGNGSYGRGAYYGNLSQEDSNRLQQARDKFFDETRELRNQIRDKRFALNDELDSANPDKAKVTELQTALSRLQSDYDQKALAYRLDVRKILPESAGPRGYGYGPGNGGCAW
jgi:zinc resistance-associated protein